MEKSYRYLGYFFLLILPLVIVAFYPTYIVQFPNFSQRNDFYAHIHAAISVVWMAMLIAQPFLIASKKFELHRKIGKLSYFIFPLLIISFVPQIIKSASYNFNSIFFPIADSLVMIPLYALAIYHRKDSARHMRYIIAMTLMLLAPTVGRIGPILSGLSDLSTQNLVYAIIFSILILLSIYDRSNHRSFKPFLFAAPFFLAHALVYYIIFL